jgi:DNA polymerase-3 subunit beta
LQDFLFEFENNKLKITASDLESTISTVIDVEANTKGKVAVPHRILMDTLKTFPDQPLSFSVSEENYMISVASDSGKFKIAGHDADEFPKNIEISAKNTLNIDAATFAVAVHRTLFATGNDELKPVMMGIYMEIGPEKTNFVASDSHKLVKYSRTDITNPEISSVIIPKRPLNILKTNLLDFDGDVKIEYNEKNIAFTYGNTKLVSRIIDGRYPNYEAVIPTNNPNRLTVEKNLFLNILRRVSNFSSKSTYQVRLKIAGSELQVSAEDIDFSNEAVERIPCEYLGDDLEIGFNSKFLIEMLNNIDSDQITFDLSAPNRAGILKPAENTEDNEDLLMLVMPIMLGN